MLRIAANMNFHVVDYAADDDEVIVVVLVLHHGRHEPEVQLSGRKRERFLLTLPLRKKLNVCIIYIFYF